MYLKKLEIQGFKSFAKKTLLEFEPGITSVVGPNGSGKSNLADGLRWVFGEQSMKLLRGKKSEDVIFAGSDKKARLGGAEVSIFFDNADHKIPIDYEEVVITRRVYRDGISEYILNGSQVRLLDIQELLASTGFGNTSYHVISQGAIDQLILGGPVAIKELIEEASGVKPYYQKREKTLRRLERTNTNLEQVKVLLEEIAPRLRSLRRQTKKLEQRYELEAELREFQMIHYNHDLRGLDSQIGDTRLKQQVFQKDLKQLEQEIVELSKSIDLQENEVQSSSEDYRKLKQDFEALYQQKLKVQENLAMIRGQLKAQSSTNQSGIRNWLEFRAKFKEAYQNFLELIENYTPNRAKEVQHQFGKVSQLVEESEGQDVSKLKSSENELGKELDVLIEKIQTIELDLKKYTTSEDTVKQQLFVKEKLVRNKQENLVRLSQQKNTLDVDLARLQTRREGMEAEAKTELGAGFAVLPKDQSVISPPPGLQEKIFNLKKQLFQIGGVDELIQQEHKETEARFGYLQAQSLDLEKGMADLKTVIKELDEVIKKEFGEAFEAIAAKFSDYFRSLFSGGRASMVIQKSQPNPEAEQPEETESKEGAKSEAFLVENRPEVIGIEIRAVPPGKKLGGIFALSGGERALTAIALLSAILATFPSPFVVLDEVDAALDEANSIRFGKILGSLATHTQFITITHNRETMRQSHTLYGVTMGDDGVSKILSLKLDQAAVYSAKN